MVDQMILDRLQDDILVMNTEKKIVLCNKHLLDKLGYGPLRGEDAAVILGGELAGCGFKEEKALQEDIAVAFINKEGKKTGAHVDIIAKEDGGEKRYWLIVKYWDDENYTKQELEMILEHIPLAIWIEDFRGKYRYTNRANIRFLNLVWGQEMTKEDFYQKDGRTFWQDKCGAQRWEEDNKRLLQGEIIHERRGIRRKDKIPVYSISKFPIKDEEGKIKSIVAIKSSKIALRRAEEELIEAYREYKQPLAKKYLAETGSKDEGKLSNKDYYDAIAQAMGICEYEQERGRLKVAASIGKQKELLGEIEKLPLSPEEYDELIDPLKAEQTDRIQEMLHNCGLSCILGKANEAVIQYPICHKEECFGLLTAIYKRELAPGEMDKKEFEDVAHNLAVIINTNQLIEQVNKELSLRKTAEQHIDELFNTTMGLYSMYNHRTKTWKANNGWHELLGWSPEEYHAMNKEVELHAIYEEDREEFIHKMELVKQGVDVGESISRFNHREGGYSWVRWKAKYSEAEESFFMYGVDVTKEVESLEERKACKKALELETMKNEFLANMSHELKTPLNIIYGIIQLVETENNEADGRQQGNEMRNSFMQYESIMKQNIFRLLRLINNIVDISRIGAGAYTINLQNCNIVEVIENVTMSVVEYTRGHHVEITFDTQEEEIETACDSAKMERIMLNLLSNAVKYSKETGHVFVNVFRKDKQVVIEVKDDGIGIPEEKQKKIFERFVQVDQSFTRKCEGSGIGLSLVRSLVEMMDGTIEVQSMPDKGSTFTIKLPIRKVEDDEQMHLENESTAGSRIERCHIEFSDIYEHN